MSKDKIKIDKVKVEELIELKVFIEDLVSYSFKYHIYLNFNDNGKCELSIKSKYNNNISFQEDMINDLNKIVFLLNKVGYEYSLFTFRDEKGLLKSFNIDVCWR